MMSSVVKFFANQALLLHTQPSKLKLIFLLKKKVVVTQLSLQTIVHNSISVLLILLVLSHYQKVQIWSCQVIILNLQLNSFTQLLLKTEQSSPSVKVDVLLVPVQLQLSLNSLNLQNKTAAFAAVFLYNLY